jgi:ferritin-like protein
MAQINDGQSLLSNKTKDINKAITSLREELDAVDLYNQRVDTATDESVKAIMAHNRDEEIEHACMLIEWLRRNMDKWDDELSTYLFTKGDITDLEGGSEEVKGSTHQGLNIGSMK